MNLCNPSVIKEVAGRYGFHFSKSLGQNFLINPSVCPRIAELGGSDGIIEIGTGFGVLTAELAKVAKKVTAIEIDSTLLPVLQETLAAFDNINIVNADVLKVDLPALIAADFPNMEVSVCANLPYYITSPILMYLLEQKLPIKSITVMVQKEAADRLCAKLGTRESSAITFAVNYYATPHLLFPVSRGSFMPAPNVDSAVLRLDVHPPLAPLEEEAFLFHIVKMAFAQRRKTMTNPLSAALGIEKSAVVEALSQIGAKPTARPEELTMEQFLNLASLLRKHRQSL